MPAEPDSGCGPAVSPSPIDNARLALLRRLADSGYRFTTPAPSSHRRVLLRRGRALARSLEDIFGWSLPFRAEGAFADLAALMDAAGLLRRRGERLSSGLRVASIEDLLFFHSAFPPGRRDAVFFGPDSYRFAAFIRTHAPPLAPGALVVDIGAGAGVGGIVAAAAAPGARLVLADVSGQALELAAVNAAFAGLRPRLRQCDGMPASDGPASLILANPPYLGGSGRIYSDGGGPLGAQLSLAWTRQALARLAPGGRLLLYTGAAILRGRDPLQAALRQIAGEAGCPLRYEELDPDVFPSTLLHRGYWGVERIAAVGAVMDKPGGARNLAQA